MDDCLGDCPDFQHWLDGLLLFDSDENLLPRSSSPIMSIETIEICEMTVNKGNHNEIVLDDIMI